MTEHLHIGKPSQRAMKEAELAGRRYQRRTLEIELDHVIQTHQDPSFVRERLADLDASMAKLEHELRDLP